MIKAILIVTILLISTVLVAQSTVVVSGGNASGNGSVSYTVGQVVYTSTIVSSGSVLQGIQQSVELFTLSNPGLQTLVLEAFTYPNPATNNVNLVLKNTDLQGLSYILFDLKGTTILEGAVDQDRTLIPLEKMAVGIYILKVNQLNSELKTFKIIKK